MQKNMKLTGPQKVMELLSAAFLLGMFFYLIFRWGSIPSMVPSHYGAGGEADAWNTKGVILLMPFIALILYGVLSLITFFPNVWQVKDTAAAQGNRRIYAGVRGLLTASKCVMTAIFCYITICSASLRPLGKYFTAISVLAVLGVILFYTVKIILSGLQKPNPS